MTDFGKKGHLGKWFVNYHARGCFHCEELQPTWKQLSQKNTKDIHIAEVEADQTERVSRNSHIELPDLIGYPTLIMYQDGKIKKEYTGNRSIESLSSFASSFASQKGGRKSTQSRKRRTNKKSMYKKRSSKKIQATVK